MKRQIVKITSRCVLIVLALSSVMVTSAQVQKTPMESGLSPKIGVKGGVNISNLYVKDVEDKKWKPGLNLGLFAKIPVTTGFSIQPELLYSSKGSKIAYDDVFSTGEYRFNLNYVEIPVLAVINIAKNFNIHAGPYISYLASAKIKQVKDDGTNDDIVNFDEDDFNRIDFGLAGGLAVDVMNFTIGARYDYGLSEVGKSDVLTTSALRNSKNSNIALYVGFGF